MSLKIVFSDLGDEPCLLNITANKTQKYVGIYSVLDASTVRLNFSMSQRQPLSVMDPSGLETTPTIRQIAANIDVGGFCGGCEAVADVQIGIYGGSF